MSTALGVVETPLGVMTGALAAAEQADGLTIISTEAECAEEGISEVLCFACVQKK